jgi:streptogramin lyase
MYNSSMPALIDFRLKYQVFVFLALVLMLGTQIPAAAYSAPVQIDGPTLTEPIPTGHHPTAVTSDGRKLWVISQDGFHNVQQIDPESGEVSFQFYGGNHPQDVLYANGAVWVAYRSSDAVQRIDPVTYTTLSTPASTSPRSLAWDSANGVVWVANTGFDLLRGFDHDTTDRLYTLQQNMIEAPRLLAGGEGEMWVAGGHFLQRIDLAARTAEAPLDISGYPYDLLWDGEFVWVTTALPFTLLRIDKTGSITRLDIGKRPFALAFDGKTVWLSDYDTGNLYQLDPDTGLVLQIVSLGYRPHDLFWDGTWLWVVNILGDSVQALVP